MTTQSEHHLRRRIITPESELPVRVLDSDIVELIGRAYRRVTRKLLDIGGLRLVGGESPDFHNFERETADGSIPWKEEAVLEECDAAVVAESGGGEVNRWIDGGLGDHHGRVILN